VNGICVAGGMELVCFSDLVIAARSARFADGHAGVGLLPIAGSVSRLVARVGSAQANRLLLEGVFLDADEALRIGLVGQVVDDDQLDHALEATCTALAARPAPALARLLGLARPVDEARRRARQQELDAALANVTEPHVVAGLTAFLGRRSP
jgi:enoyl-CoA hydratase/carnithine racemase